MTNPITGPAGASLDFDPESATLRAAGTWTTRHLGAVERTLASMPTGAALTLDARRVTALDTAGAWLIGRWLDEVGRDGASARVLGLDAHRDLLALVRGQRGGSAGEPPPERHGALERVGRATWEQVEVAFALIAFLGEITVKLVRTLRVPWRLRGRAVAAHLETAGFRALPIVGLLSFLIGVVIAYQGGVQLRTYGANIFIVELVTLTAVRELGPLLAAIVVAGRTGSAFAAQIATMQVSEEVDALRAMGVDPIEVLVIPRLLALVLALPLLTVFADAMAVLGGMAMSAVVLDVSLYDFAIRVPDATSLTSFLLGVAKAPVFAAILAIVGCFQGLQAAGGGADSVGVHTTLSVVQGIFLVIVADAVFSVLFSWLGI